MQFPQRQLHQKMFADTESWSWNSPMKQRVYYFCWGYPDIEVLNTLPSLPPFHQTTRWCNQKTCWQLVKTIEDWWLVDRRNLHIQWLFCRSWPQTTNFFHPSWYISSYFVNLDSISNIHQIPKKTLHYPPFNQDLTRVWQLTTKMCPRSRDLSKNITTTLPENRPFP